MQLQPNGHDSKSSPPEWVVWDYTPAEWQAFDVAEWGRAEQAWQRRITLICLAAAIVLGMILFLLLVGAAVDISPLVIFGGIAAIALLMNSSIRYQRALACHQARRRGPPQVRLGPGSITVGTNTTRFAPPADLLVMSMVVERHLYWVRFVAGPPAQLVFALTYGRGGPDEMAVPVPAGAQDAAIALVARYKREVIRRRPTLSRPPNALPSRPAQSAPLAPALPTDHPTQHLLAFDPDPVHSSHPTQRLPRQWVGGTPTAQRYGTSAPLAGEAAALPVSDTTTQRLPPDGTP